MQNSLTCYLGDQHFKLENNKKSHNNLFPQSLPFSISIWAAGSESGFIHFPVRTVQRLPRWERQPGRRKLGRISNLFQSYLTIIIFYHYMPHIISERSKVKLQGMYLRLLLHTYQTEMIMCLLIFGGDWPCYQVWSMIRSGGEQKNIAQISQWGKS